MRKAYKSLISLAVILIAGLNFIVPAFAQDPFTAIAIGGIGGASGAGLFGSMAAMSGIDISWGNNSADQMDAMWNVLNPDHVYFSGEKHEATNVGEDVYDYIKVDIGDWLSAQSDFITTFIRENNVTDNDSGTINIPTSYYGYNFSTFDTYLYYYGPSLGTLVPGLNVHIGNIGFIVNSNYQWVASVNGQGSYSGTVDIGIRGKNLYLANNVGGMYWGYLQNNGTIGTLCRTDTTGRKNPTNVNWSSNIVDDTVFDGWSSAKVKIPSSISQLQTGWTPVEFFNELDRIWSGAGEDNIIIENGGDTPVPPVPVPDTPLGDVPFDDWVDLWGQGIYQQLENQSDALDLIGSNGEDAIEDLESIDSNLDDLNQTAESIDTNIGIGNGILGGIRSLAQSAVNYLEGIAEHVGELVEEIVEGTETLISGILNQIPQAFGVIFGPIKQASSIWHYVVEWIQSIGAPFQFIWSMASGTSYYIILPVYASLAAAVVLAFYKRFGK